MFFRFGAALVLIVAISLAGIAIEKRNVSLKRSLTLQQFRESELLNRRAELRLSIGRLGAPSHLMQQLEVDGKVDRKANVPATKASKQPLSRSAALPHGTSDVRPRTVTR